MHARALEVIDKQRSKMLGNLGTAIDGRDPEGVHDMRVASRRLRAALPAFEPWLDSARVAKCLRSLRRVTRTLGSVRELDVLRIRLQELSSKANAESQLAIEVVDSRIARRQSQARRKMFRELASIDVDALGQRLETLVAPRPTSSAHATTRVALPQIASARKSPADRPILALLESLEPQIIKNVRKVTGAEIKGAIGSSESSETLHDIRIRAKKLRYQLEILEPFIGPEGARVIATLRGLQDHLGDYHDDAILDEVLEKHIARQARLGHTRIVRELETLREERRTLLERDERACRQTLERLADDGFSETVAVVLAHAREKAAAATRRPRQPGSSHATGATPLRLSPSRPQLVRLAQPGENRGESARKKEPRQEPPDSAEFAVGEKPAALRKRND